MNLTLIIATVTALVAATSGWVANGWRLNAKIDQMVAKHSQELAKANQDALTRYTAMERKKQDALNEANRIALQNAAAASTARFERDRLRVQITAALARLPADTSPATRNYTETLATIFGECTERLEALAKDADGHALDSRTLSDAWPK